jgi:hypothetical protein
MKRKVRLALILGILSNPAVANWVEVASDETSTLYADPTTIRKAKGMVKMWSLVDYKSIAVVYRAAPASSPAPYMSKRMQSEYDCKEQRMRTLDISTHSGPMADGTKLFSYSSPSKWESIPPGTIEETLWKRACSKR